jgi:hypothetical protein
MRINLNSRADYCQRYEDADTKQYEIAKYQPGLGCSKHDFHKLFGARFILALNQLDFR